VPSLWDEDENFFSLSPAASGLAVSEDEKNVYVEAQVPGIDPEKIEVTFDKGMLWIKGDQVEEKSGDAESGSARKYYRRAASSFSYHVRLPETVDGNKEPVATCKNGVMKVTFEKTPEVQPKKISVRKE
jgi:HSP20 family protein